MKTIVATLALAVLSVPCASNAIASDVVLTARQRDKVGLTIYNRFGVVRDVRSASLPRGIVDVDYQDIPVTIDPTSVRVFSVGKKDLFSVQQQAYEYDLLNRESLLRRYIGKKLTYSSVVEGGKTHERVLREGILLSINPEIVKFGDEIEISPEGTISLPSIPQSLKTIPTLIWKVNNRVHGPQSINTSYIADGLSWSADYRLDLNNDETAGNLSVWVSIQNESGADYAGADIDMVAGDVRRTRVINRPQYAGASDAVMMKMESTPVTGQPFFDYYLFHLPSPIDLINKQTTQYRLMTVDNVAVAKSYVLETNVNNGQLQRPQEDRFDVRFAFDNKKETGLGVPLPKGRFRVFKASNDGVPKFLGENNVPNTPRNEHVAVTVGKTFDLIAEHTQTSYRRTGERSVEVGYKVKLRNRKQQKVVVKLDEKIFGDWTITRETLEGKRVDSSTQEYAVTLKPDSETSFEYVAKISY